MKNYYFVAASLPDIKLDQELEITFSGLMELFAMNLSKGDREQIALFRNYFDVENVFHLMRGESFNPKGNFFRGELEEAILHVQGLPNFLAEFLSRYTKDEERQQNSFIAYELYFRETIEQVEGFLRDYLLFERKLRLCLAAYRAKQEERPWEHELIEEERTETFTMQLLAQKEGKTLDFPFEFRDLYEKLQEANTPRKQNRAMAKYRLEKIDEMSEFPLFSFEFLIAYMAKLVILEEVNNVVSR
ncbi:MAG: hypothetical protein ChlgKO_07320 [Chlamydiales bacterium]